MGEVRGGEIVVRYLKEVEGIDTIFSLSGGHIMPIYDGCPKYDVNIIDVRHEQSAVMMAQAWAIFKEKPGVCLVTAGPGFTNSLTGVANAYLENAPVVVISGMAAIQDLDKGALQDMNQVDMIRPVVKWTGRCHEIKRLPEYMEMAFRYAVSGRPGPVFLEIPPDTLYARVEEEEISYPSRGSVRYEVVPDEKNVKEAVELINNAERPILIGGSGISNSKCAEELRAFVEKTGIPTLLMGNGRGAIPDEHPLSLWDGGMMGMMAAITQADLVLSIGIRFNWVLNYGDIMPNAKVIRVDIDPAEVDRNRMADVALVGDATAVLRLLNRKVEEGDHNGWIDSLRGTFANMTQEDRQKSETPSDPIHPIRLMHLLRQVAGDDHIFIVDGGDTAYFAMVNLRAQERAGVIGSGTLFGCLGTGVPFAIGAQLARPDKQVILVTGDGSFGFNNMEFETASRHCIPIVSVICNDQAWGMVKHGHEICYETEEVCGTELGVVHYEQIVEALGGYGEFVEKDEQIAPAIENALKADKPACVNVITDPTVTSLATMMFAEGFNL